jgi:hypothetical protein
MNTRMYPRTLAEAFPKTPEYASAVERPRGEPRGWWAAVVCIAIVGAVLVWVTR